MGGGGIIIIRNAVQTALSDPLVRGLLRPGQVARLDQFITAPPSTWGEEEHEFALFCFNHAAHNC